ncbi:hypothetical protein AHAS_Ahas11G0112800 [Arachis hypogaea]
MASAGGAAPLWRTAGMMYITYSKICANLVRNCLKEPFKTEAMSPKRLHFSLSNSSFGGHGALISSYWKAFSGSHVTLLEEVVGNDIDGVECVQRNALRRGWKEGGGKMLKRCG